MPKSFLSAAAVVLMLGGAPALAASPAATSQDGPARGVHAAEAPMTLAQRGDYDGRGMRDGRRYDERYQRREDWRRGRAWDGPRHGYRAPPPGWRRYGGRPHGWQSRGCAQIGPVWYCP